MSVENAFQSTSNMVADFIMEENSNAENSKRAENISDEIFPAGEVTLPETEQLSAESHENIAPKVLTNQDMEVHHHAHHDHGKKNWKSYLQEFFMLFLAVFFGFLAEYQLEHVIEHQREKEYALALYNELLDDSVVIANKVKIRLEKERDMDYLNSFFKDSNLAKTPKEFYPAFTTSFYLFNTYTFEPKDGILNQLRNSGSLRYFKSIELQKLFGDISVYINNIRSRNEQEYQYFASPLKPFLLKHFNFGWLDELRKEDANSNILDLLNTYRKSDHFNEGKILNPDTFNRGEASNMIYFYKQMLTSTRTLQMLNYINTNHQLLQMLRKNYSVKNE